MLTTVISRFILCFISEYCIELRPANFTELVGFIHLFA